MKLIKTSQTDKTLFSSEWVDVKETPDGYIYAFNSKTDGKGVAVLIYKDTEDGIRIYGRFEKCPAHKDKKFDLYSLTGGVEEGNSPRKTAKLETKEEAGIDAKENEFFELGSCFPSKMTSTEIFLFALNAKNKIIGEAIGDGSKYEDESYCEWVSLEDVANSKDPILSLLFLRAIEKELL
jgi:8-oxo-dGTP pyrophosphatase MutT (NUDIX family)